MPVKPCPNCGLKNPTSAATCDCGYSFGGMRLPDTAELICPRCHTINPATATLCECGRSFVEDTEEVREKLTEQLRKARRALLSGVTLVFISMVWILFLGWAVGLALASAGVVNLVRGWRGWARTRSALDLLEPRVTPPVARVVKE